MVHPKRTGVKSKSPKKTTKKPTYGVLDFAGYILDSLDSQIAVINSKGVIVHVNKKWCNFANDNSLLIKGQDYIGVNYLDVLRRARGEWSDEAKPAFEGIRGVLAGSADSFSLEYPCHSPHEQRWFRMIVTPLKSRIKGAMIRHQDITERKLLEAERQENLKLIERLHQEKKLRSKFIGMVPGGFCTYKKSPDGKYSIPFASQGWEELFEVKASEVEADATGAFERIHPEDTSLVQSAFLRAMETSSNLRLEYRIITSSKGTVWIEKFGSGLAGDDGSRLFSGFAADITERKKAEHALGEKMELENQISRMVNLAPGGFYSFISYPDGHASLIYASEKFKSLTQLNLTEAVKNFWVSLGTIHPDDLPGVQHGIDVSMKNLTMWHEEFRILRPNHTAVWVEGWCQPSKQPDRTLHWFGILVDVTDRKLEELARKRTEQLLIESEERYRTLADNSEYPVAMLDGEGTILFANDPFSQIFESTPREMIYKKLIDFMDPAMAEDRLSIIRKVIQENRPYFDEIALTNKKGTRWYKRFFRPIAGWDHNPQVLITGSDITDMKNEALRKEKYLIELESKVQERTQELRDALNKEQELVEMKNKFISTTSHEFRTPLSTISLTAGFIRRYHDRINTDILIEKLHLIEKQVRHMSLLLEDVLTIGRSDAGKLKISMTQFPLIPFIRSIVEEVEETRKTHRIVVEFNCLQHTLSTDEKLIRNIIINLLTNAIKFSPGQDKVEFTVSSDETSYYFTVRDFGVGIPDADRMNIFEPFHRGVNVSKIQGTGLGLSIVKKAVDLLGGFISVNSKVGEGTTFRVTLPIAPSWE